MKLLKGLLLLVATATGATILFNLLIPLFYGRQPGAIGIIGGADGPTAVFVATKTKSSFIPAIAAFCASVAALLLVRKKRRK